MEKTLSKHGKGGIMLPSEYADYATFKKINIIKESGE